MVKNPPAGQETWVQSLGWEDPLEEGPASHSSILAWRILWTGEPDRLQPMESRESLTQVSIKQQQRKTKPLASFCPLTCLFPALPPEGVSYNVNKPDGVGR